jgi:hypothetical protein
VAFVRESQTPAGTTKLEIQSENPKNLLCSTHGILRPYPVNRERECHGIALKHRGLLPAPAADSLKEFTRKEMIQKTETRSDSQFLWLPGKGRIPH